MTALQVRDMPEDLYETLKLSAKRNHRSISQETISLIEQGLGLVPKPIKTSEDVLRERAEERERIWAELDEINKNVPQLPPEVHEQIMEECKRERNRHGWVEDWDVIDEDGVAIDKPVEDYIIKIAV